MIATPDSSAMAVLPPSNTDRIIGSFDASSRPATMPPTMASPPRRGVGSSWTSRSRTSAMKPNLSASLRTGGVSR